MKLPEIVLGKEAAKAEALVLGFYPEKQSDSDTKEKAKKDKKSSLVFKGKKSDEVDALLSKLAASKHFSGKKAESDLLRFFPVGDYPSAILLGLGDRKKWTPEIGRQAGASVALLQKKSRLEWVAVDGESVFSDLDKKEVGYSVQAFVEGYLLAGYEYKELKKEDKNAFLPAGLQLLGLSGKEMASAVTEAKVLAQSVHFARFLGDRPGNWLTPTEMGEQVQAQAKDAKLKCRVLGRAEIEKEKMGLLLGVSNGSDQDPRFIIMEHDGGKKKDAPVVLVGKGITFDSGGISLKPALRMEDMKYDMMGAAAVAGIMLAVSRLDLPVHVVGLIATCENLPSGRATKPGDVHRSRSGKTVEIINTDAEGRLILADALDYAQTEYSPQAIIDFATLTGAVVDALGTVASGVMGNNQELIDRIKSGADATAERVWQLPLFEEYEDDLKSNTADIKNSGIREAGSSKGGTFLKFFIDSKYPWAHCDIAGTAYHRKDSLYLPSKYGAGVMIRLMTHLLQSWKPLKANS